MNLQNGSLSGTLDHTVERILASIHNRVTDVLKTIPWEEGRQGNGYKKWCLFSSEKLMIDSYLLYMPQASAVPPHKDPVKDKQHHRVNFIVHKAKQGGEFVGRSIIQYERLIYFRPDLVEHQVTEVKEGYRLVVSLGWVR